MRRLQVWMSGVPKQQLMPTLPPNRDGTLGHLSELSVLDAVAAVWMSRVPRRQPMPTLPPGRDTIIRCHHQLYIYISKYITSLEAVGAGLDELRVKTAAKFHDDDAEDAKAAKRLRQKLQMAEADVADDQVGSDKKQRKKRNC